MDKFSAAPWFILPKFIIKSNTSLPKTLIFHFGFVSLGFCTSLSSLISNNPLTNVVYKFFASPQPRFSFTVCVWLLPHSITSTLKSSRIIIVYLVCASATTLYGNCKGWWRLFYSGWQPPPLRFFTTLVPRTPTFPLVYSCRESMHRFREFYMPPRSDWNLFVWVLPLWWFHSIQGPPVHRTIFTASYMTSVFVGSFLQNRNNAFLVGFLLLKWPSNPHLLRILEQSTSFYRQKREPFLMPLASKSSFAFGAVRTSTTIRFPQKCYFWTVTESLLLCSPQ